MADTGGSQLAHRQQHVIGSLGDRPKYLDRAGKKYLYRTGMKGPISKAMRDGDSGVVKALLARGPVYCLLGLWVALGL